MGLRTSDEILEKAGLTKIGVEIYGDNNVNYWTRKEKDLLNVMVEGGPPTTLSFLGVRIIDMMVII